MTAAGWCRGADRVEGRNTYYSGFIFAVRDGVGYGVD